MGLLVVQGIHMAAVILFALVLMIGAGYDVASYRIPNLLSVAGLVAFAVAAVLARVTAPEILVHLAAGLAVLVLGAGLFAVRMIGGGDVKLMAVTAVWTGFSLLPWFLAVMTLSGGVLAVLLLVARRLPVPRNWRQTEWIGRLLSPRQGVPYGVAIAIGGLTVLIRFGETEPLFGNWF
ncbi:MAG: prepilin peptidase [Alphaproteobacteria bacterium]